MSRATWTGAERRCYGEGCRAGAGDRGPPEVQQPIDAPVRHYCYFLFFHPEMDMETQRDKATCLRSHSTKGADTGLYTKCSFDHSSTCPGGSERRNHRGPCRRGRREHAPIMPSLISLLRDAGFSPKYNPAAKLKGCLHFRPCLSDALASHLPKSPHAPATSTPPPTAPGTI